MEESEYIRIRHARVNNLKDTSVDIPRDKFVVITGLSGSGKSSLAFDTLYAEGQRRYVESLSSYARQFLNRMKKPECDFIEGLPPTIAIQQHTSNRNPRSTVGTQTEIYEYLKLLFARVGKTISPVSGQIVQKHSIEDVIKSLAEREEGIRFTVLTGLSIRSSRSVKEQLETLLKEGYTRIETNGKPQLIEDILNDAGTLEKISSNLAGTYLLISRLVTGKGKESVSRLADAVETAFYEGAGRCLIRLYDSPETTLLEFSNRFEADGMTFEEPSDNMFSFNSPMGACPKCEGFGRVMGIDESLVIPDSSLSVYDGAVVCWRGEKMGEWKNEFILQAQKRDFPIFTPYFKLTRQEKDYLWHGSGDGNDICIDEFFRMIEKNQYKIQYRVMLSRYRGKTTCPACHGTRLRHDAGYVKVAGKSIMELSSMSITDLKKFFDELELEGNDKTTAERILTEIRSRIRFMIDVGLEYLTLDRPSNTLSGGESQRINLVTSLGSSLVGSLYVLDEPSIGLHSRDTEKLINVLRQLQQIGNTVVVVEHDEEIINASDWIIDVGPDAGRCGGEIVYQGATASLDPSGNSHTVAYLTGKEKIEVPSVRRFWNNSIIVKGARQNNLKGIDVRFPLNAMTVVTGVSGSGKSTLVRQVLYLGLMKIYSECSERAGECKSIEGDLYMVSAIEFVDQEPIGKSSRSNPVTYLKAYDDIRKLFAEQPLAHQLGYRATHFSFNSEGGRCEECKGEGTVSISMQFMSDLTMECESCHGKRFKNDVLEVKYRDRNIWDILDMTINQAVDFFSEGKGSTEQKITRKLKVLQQVGLGYIKLGQSSSTLSGGENQRVKLAYYLSLEKMEPTVFIFDEPTTGLHFHDIKKLLEAFNALISRGHTVIIIEHNMDVIKCADYIIDMGPEGGDRGGNVVIAGTPEEVAACEESYTGKFLKNKLH